jgi:hypothetical protein
VPAAGAGPMAPPRCVLNNEHPCNPKPVCRSISSAFLPRAAGGQIKKAVSYVCHMSGICSVPLPVICMSGQSGILLVYIIFGTMTYTRYIADIYQTYENQCHMTGIYLVYILYAA